MFVKGGDNVTERIKAIRRAVGCTQQEFADRLGLKRNTIATYEIGKAVPSDRTISDICREFRVSEVWLRTGEGEMFIPQSDMQQLVEITTRMEMDQDDPFVGMITAALKSYYRLSDTEKAAISKLVDGMIEDLQAQKNTPDD